MARNRLLSSELRLRRLYYRTPRARAFVPKRSGQNADAYRPLRRVRPRLSAVRRSRPGRTTNRPVSSRPLDGLRNRTAVSRKPSRSVQKSFPLLAHDNAEYRRHTRLVRAVHNPRRDHLRQGQKTRVRVGRLPRRRKLRRLGENFPRAIRRVQRDQAVESRLSKLLLHLRLGE